MISNKSDLISFKYEGFDDRRWCSTATDLSGNHLTGIGAWGECPDVDTCSLCSTVSGPTSGQTCVFPFTFDGVTYDSCAPWLWGGEGAGQLWCSTKVSSLK